MSGEAEYLPIGQRVRYSERLGVVEAVSHNARASVKVRWTNGDTTWMPARDLEPIYEGRSA